MKFSLFIAIIILAGGSVFFLNRADQQARDTIRKHHLEDIERSLYLAHSIHGEFPPYGEATWCGVLNDPKNADVKKEVDEALRAQNDKYANLAKPFPSDPKYGYSNQDYFYWKRSPALMELYATLEADKNGDRNTLFCANATSVTYDYGIASADREGALKPPP